MVKLLLTALAAGILSVTLGYLVGWNEGWTKGYQTGLADALMKSAGQCIRQVHKGIK